jgi:glycosyltransferase involved in cell wall biosynthesis
LGVLSAAGIAAEPVYEASANDELSVAAKGVTADAGKVRALMETGMSEGWVLQITGCYVDMARERGGVANVVRRLNEGLADEGQNVQLVCGDREITERQGPAGSFELLSGRLRMEVFRQRRHPLLGPTREVRHFLRGLNDIRAAHVHTCFSAITERCMLELQDLGIPYVFTPHGKLSPATFGRHGAIKKVWWDWIGRRAVTGAARIAALSPVEAASLERFGLQRQRVVVIPNGFDALALNAAAWQRKRLIDEPYLLFLAYLDPRKQPEFAVQAFARSKCRQTHKLVLAGPDSYGHGGVIKSTIEKEGVQDRVVRFGPAYGDDKWQLLLGASCFVLPSLGEGLPVAACEALGAGNPLLLSKACNFSEVTAAGAGREIEAFDAAAWGAAMDQICLDSQAQSRMREAALRLARSYTWDAVIAQWRALYEKIGVGKTSRAPDRKIA